MVPPPTHFLCIPLAGPRLARGWAAFRAAVADCGLPEEAVRPLGTLHLTLGVFSLREEGEVERAKGILDGLKPGSLLAQLREAASEPLSSHHECPPGSMPGGPNDPPPAGPVTVTFRGLQTMQKASKTSVVYTPPTDLDGSLHRLCEQLRQPFLESGLMTDEARPQLLHLTLFNTVYVKKKKGGHGRRRLLVDATELLRRYEAFIWAEDLPVIKLAICRMGAKKVEGGDVDVDGDGDEAYEVEAETELERS
ncbi:hypothetical protein XA68_11602 [Ophiocordyceps unilateralis]|uniref:A-kinase anchor protein 7-like phosphoesterase domain-containing protein n=1 Tax=Ophiocordyceps unilateralis TaxID=268505 RepID=A0A2A9PF76_OPHUN|nr:hypothetical protein XA68_11602 [Ophiocordyceps unilateralis]